jgi:hypothetical protein
MSNGGHYGRVADARPRQIAFRALRRASAGDFLEHRLESDPAFRALPGLDRRLAQELLYGVTRHRAALDWLGGLAGDVLVGMDAGFGFAAVPPFIGPARNLWAEVEAVCAGEADLGAHGFIQHRREAFWLGAADGPRGARAHLRVTEQVYKASGLGVPTSNFVLLGASQVGKATLTADGSGHFVTTGNINGHRHYVF